MPSLSLCNVYNRFLPLGGGQRLERHVRHRNQWDLGQGWVKPWDAIAALHPKLDKGCRSSRRLCVTGIGDDCTGMEARLLKDFPALYSAKVG